RNELRHEPNHLIDLMSTCVELAGADYPETINGRDITPKEGRSLVAGFEGDRAEERVLMFEHFGKAAIRKGDWKLVRVGAKSPWELYNIKEDRSELNNLRAKYPVRVAELAKLWKQEADRTLIFPKPVRKKK
ncbi:MAG: arylsulfatase, partial [Opitutales bacterium]